MFPYFFSRETRLINNFHTIFVSNLKLNITIPHGHFQYFMRFCLIFKFLNAPEYLSGFPAFVFFSLLIFP